uniref:ATP-binding cassette sub-family B member 6, mitochondrial n=1 Tax=Panagrellus redivivus TaxID=6233 RepID=A0A7E4UTK8_PANRE
MFPCDAWRFWPPNSCTYGVQASIVYSAIAVFLTLFLSCRRKAATTDPSAYQRLTDETPTVANLGGPVTRSFLLTVLVGIVNITLPWIYFFAHYKVVPFTPIFFIAATSHSLFWAITTVYHGFLINRKHVSLWLLLVYFVAVLLIAPVFALHEFFPDGFFHAGHFAYLVVEAVGTVLTILLTATGYTLRDFNQPDHKWLKVEKSLRQVGHYIWPRKDFLIRLRIYVCVVIVIIGRVTNIVFPLYSKWIIDELAKGNFCYQLIIGSVIMKFFQGSGMGGFLNTVRSQLWIAINQYTTREIQMDMFAHIHQLSLSWHLSRKTGEVLKVMDRGTRSIQALLNYIVFNITPTIVDILIATVFFFVMYNYYFGILVLVTMVIYLATTIIVTEWRTKQRRDLNKADNEWQTVGVDSILNYETVKYYSAEQVEYNRYKAALLHYQKHDYLVNTSLNFLNLLQNFIIGLSMLIGTLLIGYFIAMPNSKFTAGDYSMFTTYLLQLYGPLNIFGTLYRTIQNSFVDMENMFELLNKEVDIVDSIDAVEVPPGSLSLNVNNVSFHYSEGQPILKNISFTVQPGKTIAIVGASGGGKSTIIRLLFRLYDVTDGSICFGDTDIRDLKLKSLRGSIGIVPQDTVLFNDTIGYNIRYGRPGATDEEVEAAAEAAQILDLIKSMPNGYDTIVGERGLKLSGGEKQRVAIARTILKNPAFLLLDEATSALDSITESRIQINLKALARGRTCVIVAHRLSTIKSADIILVMRNGNIVQSGSHVQLVNIPGEYRELWQLQHSHRQNSHDQTDQ